MHHAERVVAYSGTSELRIPRIRAEGRDQQESLLPLKAYLAKLSNPREQQ
jgi:hypothetical protein